jgi:hypothetical protein
VYSDPGRPLILGRANVLDLGIGLMRGMVTPGEAPLTKNVGGYDFSTWRGGLVHNDDSESMAPRSMIWPVVRPGKRILPCLLSSQVLDALPQMTSTPISGPSASTDDLQ